MQKQDPQHDIKFYRKNQQYGYFSNFYPSPIVENGIKYPTVQHYFQSKKFQGHQYALEIAQISKPVEAFRMGQSRQIPIKQNWDNIKQKVMYDGLKLKFTLNPDLKTKLLETGDRKLIEHTDRDKYWGDGFGKGKNRLGVLLMEVRKQLRQNVQK